jgi:O-antigen/teichoic acid export membrane protein
MNRTRNSALNLASALAHALASAAASLLAAPLLLRWLGPERLGAYKALTDWIGYLALFELGLGGALMAAFAGRLGQGDHAAVRGMLAAGLRAYCRVMLAQLAGGAALVIALPYLIPLDRLSEGELRVAGAVALLPVVFAPLLVFRSLVEARQRGYVNWLLLTAQVLLMTGLSLLAARFGGGLVGQGGAFAAAQIVILLALAWDGARAYRGAWKVAPAPADRGALWGLSWPTFVHGLTDRIGLVSDNIIIAWILGPAAVVPFYLTQQLAALAQFLLRGVGQATWAGLAELYARGDAAGLRMRLLELTGMVSGLGLAAIAPIAACNRHFVQLWVGRDAYAGEAVTALACFNALLWAVYTLWGWALLGSGQIRRWAPFAMLSTLVNVAVSLIATARLGLAGPLLGTAAGLLLITSWALPRALDRVFGIPPRMLWRAALIPLRWGLPLAAVLRAIVIYHPLEGWLELLAMAASGSVVGLALWWRLSLGSEERSEWRARLEKHAALKSLLGRVKK